MYRRLHYVKEVTLCIGGYIMQATVAVALVGVSSMHRMGGGGGGGARGGGYVCYAEAAVN